jgi:hypothetical protein
VTQKPLEQMRAADLEEALAVRVFEANLIVRALSIYGVRVHLDLVERVDVVHPGARTEIIVRVEER